MSLLDVCPAFAPDNSTHLLKANVEKLGYLFMRFTAAVKLPNFANVVSGKFRSVRSFAASNYRRLVSTFRDSITHVIEMRSKKQMVRVDTRSIIAAMENVQLVRNGTASNYPRNSVSRLRSPVNARPSITKRGSKSLPFPTVIGTSNINFIPEAGMFGKIEHAGNLLFRLFATHLGALTSQVHFTIPDYTIGEV